MAKQENKNVQKIAVISARFADYTSKKTGRPVKGWFVDYLEVGWNKRPDGVQEMKFVAKTAKLETEKVPTDIRPGIYNAEIGQFDVNTLYGVAYQTKPVAILERIENLTINLL